MKFDKAAFLTQVTLLAKKLKCYGSIPGQAPLPPTKRTQLSLNRIAHIAILMQDVEKFKKTLSLGASPEHQFKGFSLIALAKIYDNQEIMELLAKETLDPSPRKRPTKQ